MARSWGCHGLTEIVSGQQAAEKCCDLCTEPLALRAYAALTRYPTATLAAFVCAGCA